MFRRCGCSHKDNATRIMQPMAPEETYPRHLVLAGAVGSGILLALAVHMLGQRIGLDLAGLWRRDQTASLPIAVAGAWWLIAMVGFAGGYMSATLMDDAASGTTSRSLWLFLGVVMVLLLAGAGLGTGLGSGLGASAPATGPIADRVLAGVAALVLGAAMSFCGAHFATGRE